MRFLIWILAVILLPPVLAEDEGKQKVVIALIGDSTVTDSAGWGKAFADRFGDAVVVKNFAAGGRSAKSWLDEGRMDAVIEADPDFALIQFGHNGQPGKGPKRETDPATTYRDFLKMYVKTLRGIGTEPILVSSVTRRDFTTEGKIRLIFSDRAEGEAKATRPLQPWAEAAGEVAAEMNVPFVDLYTASVAFHNRIGEEESATFSPKEGDITHFNEKGAGAIADLVTAELRELGSPLVSYFEDER